MSVRPITADEHLGLIASRSSASFLQTPAWGAVKSEWTHESVGWFRDGELVGAALVLYRQLPRLRRYLAYLPEGPVIDWASGSLADWLDPLTAYLKANGAFGVRMGPPVRVRQWSAAQVKEGIADEAVSRPPVLLVHGDRDDVVPIQALPEAARALEAAGWSEVFAHVMKGSGHGIAPDGLGVALAFMRDRLGLS